MNEKKVFRFAPSPTGTMHLGNCRTAIINAFFAKKINGTFFLRIDDTDENRDKEDYENIIYEDLAWLGIEYKTIIKQSERTSIYDHYFEKLKKEGRVYECFEREDELIENTIYDRKALFLPEEEKENLRKTRKSYWRFFLKEYKYNVEDKILGKITLTRNWSDPIIKRPKEEKSYTYNFTSAVDDYLMEVTHIIRAQEHFYNSTIQQEIIDSLGGKKIEFAHLPLISNKEGHKLSKRKGSLSISTLREKGYHPYSIISLCLSLGSSRPPLISNNIDEFINYTDLLKFSKNSPKFGESELMDINRKILKNLDENQINKLGFDLEIWTIIKNNLTFLKEYEEWKEILINKNLFEPFEKKNLFSKIYSNNKLNINLIEDLDERRKFCIDFRKALTGKETGPELELILNYKIKHSSILKELI